MIPHSATPDNSVLLVIDAINSCAHKEYKDLIETTDDEERQAFQRYLKQRTWPLMYGTTVESHHILEALQLSRP